MPVIENAMAVADEPRAVDHVGPVLKDRLDQPRILGWIVFQVGVLNDHHVAGGVLEAGPQSGALALIVRLEEDADFVALQLAENLPRAVGAAIIDKDDLFRNGHFLHTANDLANPLPLVVDRDDDGELETVRDRIDAELPAGRFAEQAPEKFDAVRRTRG